ncbi:MAG: Gfo/Idh/MocA family oxidoreductase [Planctomycetota bacterium]|nr:Gfo/Idh/MocA family oxidoreductase [Planctomycetota bacterium]MDA1214214.1 Gfo/Idh/MocA family oxidoreductase [Planctomycetota bacterium]
MIHTGILGLGAHWDDRYGPVLKALRQRISVRAVYNCVTNRAEQIASELGANVVQGVRSLMERSDIQAVLWIDPAWHGIYPLQAALSYGKPIFLGGSIQAPLADWQALYATVQSQGLTVIPELGRRYTPATSRLHELMATQLGKAQHISIQLASSRQISDETPHGDIDNDLLMNLMDWCRYVMRARPAQLRHVTAMEQGGSEWTSTIEIVFHQRTFTASPPVAELTFVNSGVEPSEESKVKTAEPVRIEIRCEQGRATIIDPVTIVWQTNSSPVTECLQSERTELEVMFDLFCRRVVGGLIPVADLGDICRSLYMVEAARRSYETRQAIVLNGESTMNN